MYTEKEIPGLIASGGPGSELSIRFRAGPGSEVVHMFRIIGIMLPLMLAGLIAPHLSGQQVPLNMTISVSPNGPLYSPNTFEVDVYLTPTNTGGVWPSGMVQPTGSVEFTGNGNFWSNSSLRAAGYAFCVYTGSIMPADLPLTIVASYPGDANYAPISKSISFTYLAGTVDPESAGRHFSGACV